MITNGYKYTFEGFKECLSQFMITHDAQLLVELQAPKNVDEVTEEGKCLEDNVFDAENDVEDEIVARPLDKDPSATWAEPLKRILLRSILSGWGMPKPKKRLNKVMDALCLRDQSWSKEKKDSIMEREAIRM
ncbi:hypothetical protein ACJX0J_016074 [Zea mays]